MGHKKKVSYHQGGFYCSSLPVGLGGNLNFFKENCGILRIRSAWGGSPTIKVTLLTMEMYQVDEHYIYK